jgi:hypothetical protein
MREFFQKNKKRITLVVSIVAVLILLLYFFGSGWDFARAQALQAQLMASENPFDQNSRGKWQELQKLERKLTPQQREALDIQRDKLFDARDAKRTAGYFKLPQGQNGKLSKEQFDYLKKEIERQEQMRKQFEQRRNQFLAAQGNQGGRPGGGPGGGGPGGGGPGGGGPGGGGPRGGGPGGGGPGGGGRSSRTPEQRMASSRARLDRSTPDRRADRAEYRADMGQARAMMGLSPQGSGRGGPGGGGGRR